MKSRENANFTEKAMVACEMMLTFVISTPNNPFVQNLNEFHEAPYLGLPHRNLTKVTEAQHIDNIDNTDLSANKSKCIATCQLTSQNVLDRSIFR
ncbi:hypothetical protein Y032_0055g2550 [Ancylostoma ceylanicum]|uniref:Uncharacterized protein n=1 Tax=Ancylostoma ceylanicum TaxID=53326 RepID=A0A016U744_9BILA|nr:hypothetical protein Y032_0055g2550 [Ancylostoma ceylanicum]